MTRNIKIKSEYITLQQILKYAGIFPTCGMAKNIILDGLVLVNGQVCIQRGKKLYFNDVVEYNEEKIIVDKI